MSKGTPNTTLSHRFKPYLKYKDSGVEWLGEIPTHWDVKRLKYVADARTDKLLEKPEELPYLGLEQIESKTGRLLLGTPVENVDSTVNKFSPGDVLFGKLRPYLAKVALVDFHGVCTSELLVLHPHSLAHGRFLFYQLLCDDVIRLVNAFTYGTKMPRASPEQIGNVALPIVSDPEQRAIAAFLDHETAKIDAMVAKKERLIELLQEKRAVLITQAVTKGLDPTVPMKDSGVEWLGKVPDHWDIKKGRHLGNLLGSQNPDGLELDDKGEVLYVKVDDLNLPGDGLYLDESTDRVRIPRMTPKPQTRYLILFPKRGAAIFTNKARIVRRPVLFDSNIMGWSIFAGINIEYITYALLARGLTDLADVSSVPQINNKHIYPAWFPLPPSSEQLAIVLFIQQETAKLDMLIAKVREGIEKLKEYRTVLISAAVTGKIDVREKAAE